MTPAPARITENMAASRGLEDVWCARGAALRSRAASCQRAGCMSDGFLSVDLFVSSSAMQHHALPSLESAWTGLAKSSEIRSVILNVLVQQVTICVSVIRHFDPCSELPEMFEIHAFEFVLARRNSPTSSVACIWGPILGALQVVRDFEAAPARRPQSYSPPPPPTRLNIHLQSSSRQRNRIPTRP